MYNFISALQIRGGENILEELAKNYTDSGNPNCIVGKGLRYLNNLRLRTIVYYLFKAKAKKRRYLYNSISSMPGSKYVRRFRVTGVSSSHCHSG
jgi:hypothetical protein